jgi:hypothetical protein
MPEDLPIPRQDGRAGDLPPRREPPSAQSRATGVRARAAAGARAVCGAPRRIGAVMPIRAVAGLGRDRRIVPLVGGLGAIAVLTSFTGEWTVVTLPDLDNSGNPTALRMPGEFRLANSIAELSGFGAGYLVGVFVLLAALALVVAGTPGVRRNARVVGLAVTVGVVALLVGITMTADDIAQRQLSFGISVLIEVTYGRGLVTAYLGTALLGAALLIAGRFIPDGGSTTDEGATTAGGSGAGSNRPVDIPPPPIDLTVTPIRPFTGPDRR